MNILVFEFALDGHHANYLKNIIEHLIKDGHKIVLVLPKHLEEDLKLRKIYRGYAGQVNVRFMLNTHALTEQFLKLGILGRQFIIWLNMKKFYSDLITSEHVDQVFIPYFDNCLYSFALLGSPFQNVRWSGICMQQSFHYTKFNVIVPKIRFRYLKRVLFLKLLLNKYLISIFTIDALLKRYFVKYYSKLSHRIQYLPDPVELKKKCSLEAARAKLRIPKFSIVILVFGSIDERKSIDLLINCVFKSSTQRIYLLIVGKQNFSSSNCLLSEEARSLRSQDRLQIINEFVDDNVAQLAFSASDYVWLGYRNHYTMSGVLLIAANFGKPVISTNIGLIGWYTRNYNLGFVFDLENTLALSNFLDTISERGVGCEVKNLKLPLRFFNWDNFYSILKRTLFS